MIDVAIIVRFTGHLEHDLSSSLTPLIGKEDVGCVPNAEGALPPEIALSEIPHGGRSEKENTSIVRPLDMVDLGAVDLVIATVVEIVVITH